LPDSKSVSDQIARALSESPHERAGQDSGRVAGATDPQPTMVTFLDDATIGISVTSIRDAARKLLRELLDMLSMGDSR
jgi:hypothetical protein